MKRRFALVSCGLLAVVTGGPLGAQRQNFLEVGVSVAQFREDHINAAGPSLRAAISGVSGRVFYNADVGAIATIGSSSGYAGVEVGARTLFDEGWFGELAVSGETVAGSGGSGGVGTGELRARTIWIMQSGGGWFRASAHASARVHTAIRGGGMDAGAWWYTGSGTITTTLLHDWTRAEVFLYPRRGGFAGTAPVEYTDASLLLHHDMEHGSIDGSVTVRRDAAANELWEPGYSIQALHWMSERIGFTVSYARQLSDWVRGADGATVTNVGLRYRPRSLQSRNANRVLVSVDDAPTAEGTRTLRVQAASARSVDVMGDFTDWTPRSLARDGSVFSSSITVTGGTHRILVRINGGEWKPANNTPAIDDEFGGKAGVLVVP